MNHPPVQTNDLTASSASDSVSTTISPMLTESVIATNIVITAQQPIKSETVSAEPVTDTESATISSKSSESALVEEHPVPEATIPTVTSTEKASTATESTTTASPPTFGAPTRQFLNQTVTTGLMQGMRYLVAQRDVIESKGQDPLAVLGQYLLDLSKQSKSHS
ncbi:hypothetical protein NADFUDRAFT_42860 [Nadsonia fulvescens var. elongata DSM 6958]|uniref:Uncharacterized protein n=1 Tax=Nadsonia fulvescens var. elongata DSM 6958 TaxID=857566 RepID=A0A1E3PGK9_9ASCO|nr:hypothetical protein NADFUDRAFT_42860 [Nadsonia fulvescens var. elongata DSM 6958]